MRGVGARKLFNSHLFVQQPACLVQSLAAQLSWRFRYWVAHASKKANQTTACQAAAQGALVVGAPSEVVRELAQSPRETHFQARGSRGRRG